MTPEADRAFSNRKLRDKTTDARHA
jgi:hypothetical protein